jgi:hypothetical protein
MRIMNFIATSIELNNATVSRKVNPPLASLSS